MKRSSEILLVAAVLTAAFLVPVVRADETATPARAEKRQQLRAAAADRLGLTAEQKTSLQSIREQERTALQALKNDTSLTAEQRKAKAQEIRQTYRAQSQAVFTPEQQAKMKEFRANHPNLGQGRPGGLRGRGHRGAGAGGSGGSA